MPLIYYLILTPLEMTLSVKDGIKVYIDDQYTPDITSLYRFFLSTFYLFVARF